MTNKITKFRKLNHEEQTEYNKEGNLSMALAVLGGIFTVIASLFDRVGLMFLGSFFIFLAYFHYTTKCLVITNEIYYLGIIKKEKEVNNGKVRSR